MEKFRVPTASLPSTPPKTFLLEAIKRVPAERITRLDLAEQLAALTTGYTPDLEQEQQEPTYYDYPVLKEPIWRWEIIWYFFLGGLAAGCYVIASLAALFGSKEDRATARTGYYLSLLALLPCPLLLIKDLGRPERFLNMLRIFKVKSPMSMGVWGLVTFSMFSGVTAVIQAARDGLLGKWWGAKLLASLPQKLLAAPGTFFGLFLGGYTGVLLATTSIPLWSRSKLLGGIFITSAISTSSALISLILRLVGAPAKALHKLERLEWAAMLVEMVGLLTFLRGSGRAARPLVGTAPTEQGHAFWRFMFGGGLVLPWLLQTIVLSGRRPGKQNSNTGLIISLLVLIGGYFLRRTIIKAGHVSSRDARTTLWNARR
ncbi:MAG TPA: NrfD/PsrC family molybdoenzyme membrane anchor subunit [Ktedonobacteraceae bacterium]|nr:NrfD/PsrC family molybdoenzyme membrane anchor subunit [Ktedonobacteraceae bacterium]